MLQETKQHEVTIDLPEDNATLKGFLTLPENADKIVVFAHGSGSGRFSPRNQYVANYLVKNHLGTLLLDLLTPKEEEIDEVTRQYRFDIPLLAERLIKTAKWLRKNPKTKLLKIGYFGSSTGAAAALIAAAEERDKIFAVVSRGGRPDLANAVLPKVIAPTLLIVGGNDFGVIELNQEAFELINTEKKLEIVPGATHLFEEPGTLEDVVRLAANWYIKH